jgi:hypothetical protein
MKAWRKVCGPMCFAQPGSSGYSSHDARHAVAIKAVTVGASEDRALGAFAHGYVDGPGGSGRQGTVTSLPPLRSTGRVRWPRSTPRASMLAPVASETRSPLRASQGDEGVLYVRPQPGGYQQGTHLVAV